MKAKWKPYNLLLPVAFVLFIFAFFVKGIVDLHLHDTYFVVARMHILITLAAALVFIWLLYRLTHSFLLSGLLIQLHLIVTIIPLSTLGFFLCFNNRSTAPRRYFNYSNWNDSYQHSSHQDILFIIFCVFLFGQVIYIFNLVAGILKLLTRKRAA